MQKQFKKIFIIAILILLGHSNINATVYYVAKGGNDGNEGTEESPFLTITKAANIMVAGDTCYIKEGTYREVLSPVNSGTEEEPIRFIAFETDSVTISATELISNWTVHEGDIYKSNQSLSLGIERNAFFYNTEVMDIARWPNNEDNNPYTIDVNYIENGASSYIKYTGIPDYNWEGGYIWYLGAHSGTSWTRQITSSTTTRINFEEVDISKWPFSNHNPEFYENGNRGMFYLFGTLDALDHEREWFYDENSQVLYFQAPDNVNPGNGICEYAARENTINITTNYIEVEGINTFGGVVILSGDYCALKGGAHQNNLQSLDELDNTDAQIGNGSIKVGGSNILIEGNMIELGSGNGIAVLDFWNGSSDVTIRNNVIRNFNTVGVHANPIRSNCPGTVIQNNTIFKCGRDGIYVSGANSDISYNDVFDCMLINNDGGVFYTVGNENSKGTKIHHNWFHDSEGPEYADGRAAGIYLDNHSKGYDVHHNVVWNITWTGIQINWDNWYLNIFNNSIWNVDGAMGRWANGYTIKDVVIKNNYASGGEWIGNSFQTNIIDEISPFENEKAKNFMPLTESALIDGGTVIAGITDNYSGLAPDIGAYERGTDAWIPGADWFIPEYDSTSNIYARYFVEKQNLEVVPNPVLGRIKISFNNEENTMITVNVYSIKGELVHSEKVENTGCGKCAHTLSNPELKSGVYIINASSGDKFYSAKAIVL